MTAGKTVHLVDAGTGNLRSVENSLRALEARVVRVSRPEDLPAGARIVLPGVGAFARFMEGLRADGLDEALAASARRGDPLLGICVGMQALFDAGEEMGEHPGLGILPGRVIPFPQQPGLKIPHTGWNQLQRQGDGGPLFIGLRDGEFAYFNHSYYCRPDNASDTGALTEYGVRFTSMAARGNVLGVQFHPEKSQRVGLQILRNFIGK